MDYLLEAEVVFSPLIAFWFGPSYFKSLIKY